MKNPFKKKRTFADRIREDELRVNKWHDDFYKFKPRLERLDKLYPNTISYIDLAISKRIHLNDDLELPDEFLCSCKLLGLKIKEVKKNTSYFIDSDWHMSIEFNDEVLEVECE